MGLDTTCSATYKKQSSVGRAQLETGHVLFRGDFRVKLALSAITAVTVKDGKLSLKAADGTLVLGLGPDAAKWASKVQSPKSRVEKLGVKPGMRVSLAGVADDDFRAELASAGADVSTRVRKDSDQIYLSVESARDLARFRALLPSLASNGALWAIRRKGLADASESATMAAGLAAGLVDVKVARFSDTHTAEKFVRRLADRTTPAYALRASARSRRSASREGGKV
jgi:hypothetical protein